MRYKLISSFDQYPFDYYYDYENAKEDVKKFKTPIDIWTNEGGAFNLGKIVAHWNGSILTEYENTDI